MFNKKNNSLPNFLHVFLMIWLQVVWGSVVHHPGLRGRRRVKTEGVKLRGVVDTVPTHHYAICHPYPRPRSFVSLQPWTRCHEPFSESSFTALAPVGGVCTRAKDRGGIRKGEREADKLGVCVEGWFLGNTSHLHYCALRACCI